jgi:lysophospholipase L1-like esterase
MRYILALALLLALSLPAQAQPKVHRILVLGDSLTDGCCATSITRTFRHLLADKLGADLGGAGLRNLPTVALSFDKYAPWDADLIVLEVGINDAIRFGPNLIAEEDYSAAYGALLDKMLATGATVVVVTPFAVVRRGAEHYPALLRYRQYILDEAAKRPGVIIADVWTATEQCRECRSKADTVTAFAPLYRGDDFHPGDEGHRVLADTILQALAGHRWLPLVAGGHGDGTIPGGTIPP